MDVLNRSLQTLRRLPGKLLRMWMIAGIAIGLALGHATQVAHAAVSVTVDRLDDPSPIPSGCTIAASDCSLRGAILYANAHPNTEIIVGHGDTFTLSIPASGSNDATTGDLDITANTTIDFGNVLCFFDCPATVKGGTGWSDRIFDIQPGATVNMVGLIIRDGNVTGVGGGVRNAGNLTLSGGTVSSNDASDYGGGIYNSGTLTVTNSTVTSNTTQRDGGGIANYNGTMTMSSSNVTLNNAVASTGTGGGGLFVMNSGRATISSSTFASNTTLRNGGGIYAGGAMTLTNTSVTANTATQSGGGIYSYGPLTITGGSIITNTATNNQGGGLYYSNGTAVMNGVNISGNHSNQAGGGINASGASASVTLANTTVDNNQVTSGNGGGVYSSAGTFIMQSNSTVNGNIVGGPGYGAGVFVSGPLTMTDTTVNGNSGILAGGGVYLQTTSSTITGSTISNNSISGTTGGGLNLTAGALTMTTSTVNGNSVGDPSTANGGGIAAGAGTTLTLVTSAISNNAARKGGGLYAVGSAAITNTTFSGNAATGDGGAIFLPGSGSSASLSNATITGNQATNGNGGGIDNVGTVTLKNTLIAGNTASIGADCWGALTSQGYNLLGNSSTCAGLANGVNGDQVGSSGSPLNPHVGALANNGGPTMTRALLVTSPAIDAGNPADCLTTDQRGVARPQYAHCDIGAYEYNGPGNPVPQINTLNPSTESAGDPGFTLTVNGSNYVINSVVKWNGSNRPTTYVNAGQLTAQISSGDIAFPGTKNVTVFNPAPGGGTSNTATLNVTGSAFSFSYLPFIQK